MNKFGVGSALKLSFSIWLKNLLPFTLLAFLVYLPLTAYTAWATQGPLTAERLQTLQNEGLERIPVLGWIIRYIKGRLAGS